ncbi:hypothetical protein TNCV_3898191 [Trichonephila clavipes]|nr:hypothetical protein TNCV_3898191 [Trichonephila clavipes]
MGAEVHEQLSRSGDQSKARPPVFKSSSNIGTYLLIPISRFLEVKELSAVDIHRELCALYGTNIMYEGAARQWFAKTESAITMQRAFRIKFDCHTPNDNKIFRWYHEFETTDYLCNERVRDYQDCNWYPAVTGSAYLDALLRCLFPQLEESEPNNFIW